MEAATTWIADIFQVKRNFSTELQFLYHEYCFILLHHTYREREKKKKKKPAKDH